MVALHFWSIFSTGDTSYALNVVLQQRPDDDTSVAEISSVWHGQDELAPSTAITWIIWILIYNVEMSHAGNSKDKPLY